MNGPFLAGRRSSRASDTGGAGALLRLSGFRAYPVPGWTAQGRLALVQLKRGPRLSIQVVDRWLMDELLDERLLGSQVRLQPVH